MTMHNVGSIAIDPSHVDSAIARALLHAQQHRFDSDGTLLDARGAIDAYARHCDAQAMRQMLQDGWKPPAELIADARTAGVRLDALPAGAGSAPRDLEYVRAQALEEVLPELNSVRLFRPDTEVPLGATSHVMERWVTSGEARIMKGGSNVPIASAGKVEERFPVVYVVCGVKTNFFQGLSVNYAQLRTFQAESQAAMRAVNERLNRLCWSGDTGTQVKGVLNYPHLAKSVLSTLFDGTATGAQVVAALSNLVGTPRIESKQTMFPNRLVVSETVHQYLTETQFAAGTDTSIAEFFLKGQVGKPNGIRAIEAAYELEANSVEMLAAGAPADMHGVLAFRDDLGATRRVVVQEPTWLPLWQSGPFDTLHVIFAATGGMVMPDVGANVLGFVTA